jgi:hypothetical protein
MTAEAAGWHAMFVEQNRLIAQHRGLQPKDTGQHEYDGAREAANRASALVSTVSTRSS